MALKFDGGLILAADSRTSMGSYTAHRMTDKITELFDGIYVCRSGSSADTQALAGYVRRYLTQLSFILFPFFLYLQLSCSIELEKRPSVKTAAYLLRDLSYNNKKYLSGMSFFHISMQIFRPLL